MQADKEDRSCRSLHRTDRHTHTFLYAVHTHQMTDDSVKHRICLSSLSCLSLPPRPTSLAGPCACPCRPSIERANDSRAKLPATPSPSPLLRPAKPAAPFFYACLPVSQPHLAVDRVCHPLCFHAAPSSRRPPLVLLLQSIGNPLALSDQLTASLDGALSHVASEGVKGGVAIAGPFERPSERVGLGLGTSFDRGGCSSSGSKRQSRPERHHHRRLSRDAKSQPTAFWLASQGATVEHG